MLSKYVDLFEMKPILNLLESNSWCISSSEWELKATNVRLVLLKNEHPFVLSLFYRRLTSFRMLCLHCLGIKNLHNCLTTYIVNLDFQEDT